VVAANLIESACAQGRNAVTAAAEIADRLAGRPMQRLDVETSRLIFPRGAMRTVIAANNSASTWISARNHLRLRNQ